MTDPNEARNGRDARLIEALRRKDTAALLTLIRRYHALMLRIAAVRLGDRDDAERVVRQTWFDVIEGIDSLDGDASLRAWMFAIITARASERARQRGMSRDISVLARAEADVGEASADESLFTSGEDPEAPFRWASDPVEWPATTLLSRATSSVILAAVETLPESQRVVLHLRDLEGWTSAEVSQALHLSEIQQRVLLHHARGRVRSALDQYVRAASDGRSDGSMIV